MTPFAELKSGLVATGFPALVVDDDTDWVCGIGYLGEEELAYIVSEKSKKNELVGLKLRPVNGDTCFHVAKVSHKKTYT